MTTRVVRLRPYQLGQLNAIVAALNNGDRVLAQAPTGSGKTVVFADLIREVFERGKRVLVLVHKDEIAVQVSRALRDLGVPHGFISPGNPVTDDLVQVASVFSLVRRFDWLRQHPPQLCVIDEAHHIAASTWTRILDTIANADILGVTATPRRLDGKPLDAFFDKLIVGPSIAELIDDEYLSPVTVFTPSHSPDLSQVAIRAGDFAVDQLADVMSGGMIVDGAVTEYERLCPGKPAIAFCVTIEHSKLVAEAFRRANYAAEHVDGTTPTRERRKLIASLDRGYLDVLTNCGLISEGLDVPGVVAAILLRPTRSLALYLQMVGRALRPAKDKDMAYVLDHAGNVYRHGLPTARRYWSLHGRQQSDGAAEGLVRCPHCGAMNQRGAETCTNCGARLGERQRREREVVPGRTLVEAVESPQTNIELDMLGLRDQLRWATDETGRIVYERAVRVGVARRYEHAHGWASHVAGKRWEQVYQSMVEWKRQQSRTTT